jgi:hypothetical protein
MKRILVTNVDHPSTTRLFNGEFCVPSNFQLDNNVSFMVATWASATFGNGWLRCYSYNVARKSYPFKGQSNENLDDKA